MHFTRTRNEQYPGMEFCCDLCNRKAEGHPRGIGNHWWYARYNEKDQFPSLWICDTCKESVE